MNLDRNVILCGFMGCGKSTVGAILARESDAAFIDMDEYIESREKTSVAELFERHGEAGFREREHAAVLELSQLRGVVLAAGGGALTLERNIIPLRRSGYVVFLALGFDECYDRIKRSDRPLVRKNCRERLKEIYLEREKLYRAAADFEVSAAAAPYRVAKDVSKLIAY